MARQRRLSQYCMQKRWALRVRVPGNLAFWPNACRYLSLYLLTLSVRFKAGCPSMPRSNSASGVLPDTRGALTYEAFGSMQSRNISIQIARSEAAPAHEADTL
eukprot:scaffold152715_cov20-Tisochrysis_lutea.AAC.6